MNFDELPTGWDQLSLDDPDLLEGVVDLFFSVRDRAAGVLLILVVSPEHLLQVPILLEDVPAKPEASEQREFAEHLCHMLSHAGSSSVAIAVGRAGIPRWSLTECGWEVAFTDACASHGIDLLGVLLATPAGISTAAPGRAAA